MEIKLKMFRLSWFLLLFVWPFVLTITMIQLTDDFAQNLDSYASETEQDTGTEKKQMSKACVLGVLKMRLRKLS